MMFTLILLRYQLKVLLCQSSRHQQAELLPPRIRKTDQFQDQVDRDKIYIHKISEFHFLLHDVLRLFQLWFSVILLRYQLKVLLTPLSCYQRVRLISYTSFVSAMEGKALPQFLSYLERPTLGWKLPPPASKADTLPLHHRARCSLIYITYK